MRSFGSLDGVAKLTAVLETAGNSHPAGGKISPAADQGSAVPDVFYTSDLNLLWRLDPARGYVLALRWRAKPQYVKGPQP